MSVNNTSTKEYHTRYLAEVPHVRVDDKDKYLMSFEEWLVARLLAYGDSPRITPYPAPKV